ncbi:hypothetical protein KC19_12G164700 [Ceratodon purpureus]|uniref:Anamorsin homolog n=1 Tax=Ceratodon purpureus TaxID=3225 RepID=A0A8T0GBL1_CERPU|nr:hypothetical protein KC19_12G164700 [Ceratodon purpureus]
MAGNAGVLLVSDVQTLPDSVEQWVNKIFVDKLSGGASLQTLTNVQDTDGKLEAGTSSLDAVVTVMQTPGRHSSVLLSEISRVLKPGGDFLIQEPLDALTKTTLERNLLLAGFVNAEAVESVNIEIAELTNSKALKPIAVRVKKPSWDSGSVFQIKRKVVSKNGNTRTNGNYQAVKLTSGDVTDDVLPITKATIKLEFSSDFKNDDDELIDEDDLLTEEDLKAPELPVAESCAPTKKACKNCSCGRAELEEKEEEAQLTAAQINNPSSACGSCGLGDAFRCAGCPYRGMPTFKLGEKITLGSSLLVADA